jgi:BirA family biotin operon repressor/biotin-[acetyl-CoA-carboxylase] ligase
MASPYTDLNRPPLREAALRRALVVPGGLWTGVRVVPETGSTNADLLATARAGAPEGQIVVAERQNAGRGRLGRQWQAPARAGLTFSVLLRPDVPSARLGWLPLLAGVALAEAVGRVAMVEAVLKWPNDMLVRRDGVEAKCAGLLAEAVANGRTGIVLGVGVNVSQRADELPPRAGDAPPATSLALVGAVTTDRDPLLRAILRRLAERYVEWRDAGGDATASGLRTAYRDMCVTLGRDVRVLLPGAESVAGTASEVDDDGRLVLRLDNGATRTVPAGDVVHVR